MKILNIMPFAPVPPTFGGALREYYLLESLTREHNVTVLTYGNSKQYDDFIKDFGDKIDALHMIRPPWERKYRRVAQLYSLGSARSYYHHENCSDEMQRKIDYLLSIEKFDAVHCEFSVTGNFKFEKDIIKVLNTHNVEYENFRRMWKKSNSPVRKWFYHREYKKVKAEELKSLRKQDIILSTSEEDKKIMQEDVPEVDNYVIPNGVDTSFFTPSDEEPEPFSLVFTGMMGYTPNNDGMLYFLDEIFPLIRQKIPEVKIYVVGSHPREALKKRASDNIIVTGFVDDVRPYVWRSNVFVVPLRMGSGTRLKVVEALAMKKPVVSTALGCEGIEVTHGESILIEDEPSDFSDAVVKLLKDEQLKKKLTGNGYDLVRENYEWSVIGERMLEVYDSLEEEIEAVTAEAESARLK